MSDPILTPWHDLPANVRLGRGTVVSGDRATGCDPFRRFKSTLDSALVIGHDSTMDCVLFITGPHARITIGDNCRFGEAVLISESELRIGSGVLIGWRATIVDSDFHPIDADQRAADAVACAPIDGHGVRPPHVNKPVIVGDDVWIGANATILKGVRIGDGAVVEPGAVVVKDVPPRGRVMGNPAQLVSQGE